jgi:hypothetical protein
MRRRIRAVRTIRLGPSRSELGEGAPLANIESLLDGMRIDLAQNATRAIDGTF